METIQNKPKHEIFRFWVVLTYFGHKLGTNRISFTPGFLQVVDIKKRPQLDDFRTFLMGLGETIPDASLLLVSVQS